MTRIRSTPATRLPGRRAVSEPEWATWTDERLLELRLCDLKLSTRGSGLDKNLAALRAELEARDIGFRPHVWLSDDWFTPDGIPGFALPFYLVHPRLAKLEQSQMLEVEGGTRAWCMRILRHEAGHAIENAYRLRRRRRRIELFGRSSAPYPKYYVPKPYSKKYVVHLESWYAQSHPDEDFAETFAVWLTPDSDWRKRYLGWPALRKLEYVDEIMQDLRGAPAVVTTRSRLEPIASLRKTLREHYEAKRRHYGLDYPNFYDRDLRRLFAEARAQPEAMPAARFISGIRREVRGQVRRWTGVYQYTVDQVIGDMTQRCRELDLRLFMSEEQTRMEFSVLLTVQTMNYLHSGRHRIAL